MQLVTVLRYFIVALLLVNIYILSYQLTWNCILFVLFLVFFPFLLKKCARIILKEAGFLHFCVLTVIHDCDSECDRPAQSPHPDLLLLSFFNRNYLLQCHISSVLYRYALLELKFDCQNELQQSFLFPHFSLSYIHLISSSLFYMWFLSFSSYKHHIKTLLSECWE